MINTRIKKQPSKKNKKMTPATRGNGYGTKPAVVYARTLYDVLVSFEQPILHKIGQMNVHVGWETIEKTVQVEAYSKDDAHGDVFVSMLEELAHRFPNHDSDGFSVQIKRVDELPQATYMRRIGAPELFAVAG